MDAEDPGWGSGDKCLVVEPAEPTRLEEAPEPLSGKCWEC